MMFDLVIHNGIIVTVNPDFTIIQDGIVCIKNGKLERVETRNVDLPLPDAKKVIDAKNGIIMPGLINTHTHLPMTLFRGLADDFPLHVWLNDYIFPAEEKHINPDSVRVATLLGCAEMILSGTTTCCDGYFYEGSVAEAVSDSGIRAVLGHGVIDFPAPGVPNPLHNVQTAVDFTEKWQDISSTIRPSIFCHTPYTCSENTLRQAKDAAASRGLLFQIHVAETKTEFDQIQSKYRKTPVQYLDNLGILDPNTLLVHTVWIDDVDIETIRKSGANVSHNPESNMKLASGIAPIPKLLSAGVTVGIGTDGCSSNNNLDLFQEMDITAKLHKVDGLNPIVMDSETVIKMATIEGAKAIGLGKTIGSLEIGKEADLIIIDVHKPHLVPMYNPISHLVYTALGSDVRDVIISGKIVARNQCLLTLDLEDILARVNLLSESIK